MSGILPPQPVGVPPGSSYWNDWYEKLRQLINNGLVGVLWSNINFSGSNITSIASRNHNQLQAFNGGTSGEYFHLTSLQHSRATTVISKAGLPTTSDIAAGQWAVYKDTGGGTVRLWTNDGGTMKSVTLV
jgi:hypothetical protein